MAHIEFCRNQMNTIQIQEPFQLESGKTLPGLTIAYHTYGKLNNQKDNVVWVCHALTANSNVFELCSSIGEVK